VQIDWRRHRFWMGIGAAIVVAFAILFFLVQQWLPPPPGRNVLIAIPRGSNCKTVGTLLKEKGLIRNSLLFCLYVSLHGVEGKLQAGTYSFRVGTPLPQIAAAIVSGKVTPLAEHVTIPEGFTVDQIADLLQKNHIVQRAAFIREVQQGVFSYPFLHALPPAGGVKYRLEGFLFPDTYEFLPNTPAHTVVDEMLANFQRKVPAAWIADAQKNGLTLYQVVTVASLIEREAKVNAERPLVASVIYNRLHHSPEMPLEIDASVRYIVGWDRPLTREDLLVDSPYNTYRHLGLPPGPIANPGLASIHAAVYPDHTSYLYYVAKNDGSGEHYFSTTFQEQLNNERKSGG
jgi:UPF0755 protein